MPDPAAVALIPVAGVITAALIAGLFALASKRADSEITATTVRAAAELKAREAADTARAELLADKNERIAMLTLERDEAATARDEAEAERDECRKQLEAIVSELALPWTKAEEDQ